MASATETEEGDANEGDERKLVGSEDDGAKVVKMSCASERIPWQAWQSPLTSSLPLLDAADI